MEETDQIQPQIEQPRKWEFVAKVEVSGREITKKKHQE